MIKHAFMAGGAALCLFAAGCHYTHIAQQPSSPEEKAWEDLIRESYPNYTPPPRTSRSFKGHTESRVSAVVKTPLQPMDDPVDETPANNVQNSEPEEIPAEPVEKPAAEAEKPAAEAAKPAAEAEKPAAETAKPAAEAEKPAAEAEKPAAEAAKPAAEAEKPAAEAAKPADDKFSPPDPTNSTVYEVKAGDTLGGIARKVYGDARHSSIIFRANTDLLKSPDMLKPGMKLIIPKL